MIGRVLFGRWLLVALSSALASPAAAARAETSPFHGERPEGDASSGLRLSLTCATRGPDAPVVLPGDSLVCTARVRNDSAEGQSGLTFVHPPVRHARLRTGTVVTEQGSVTSGNGAGDTVVRVDLGRLRARRQATIAFEITVEDPMPPSLPPLATQAVVYGPGVPGVLSDDPSTLEQGDPTRIVIGTRPLLEAQLTGSLPESRHAGHYRDDRDRGDDDRDEGRRSPIRYKLTLRNRGTADATAVVFDDTPGSHTRLESGSVATSQGVVTAGNGAGDRRVTVELGTLPPGSSATVSFKVSLEASAPPEVANQGIAVSAEVPEGVPTDDPATLSTFDPTRTQVRGRPRLEAVKTDLLIRDADRDGRVSPGDVLRYVVEVGNPGQEEADRVTFSDVPDASTRLEVGSVATSKGEVARGDSQVKVRLRDLDPGEQATVAFEVVVKGPLPAALPALANQGRLVAENHREVLTDDPETPAQADPTTTDLARGATLGDLVWDDRNGNGLQDPGEPGLAAVAVRLLDGTGDSVATTTTGSDGRYLFANLPEGSYAVEFTAPADYVFSARDQGGDDGLDSDPDPATGRTAAFFLPGGESNLQVDAGLFQGASVGDFVWHDLDGDGIQDPGEPGIGGVLVSLLDASGRLAATTLSDSDGSYRFRRLVPGDYVLEFAAPQSYVPTPRHRGADDHLDSDADPVTGRTDAVRLDARADVPSIDAGFFRPVAFGGRAWVDQDANGVRSPDEPGLGGVVVRLLGGAGVLAEAVTSVPEGLFTFERLAPGPYAVEFAAPAGHYFSPRDQGGNDGLDSDADPVSGRTAPLALISGAIGSDVDAGLYRTASLGDFVWFDDHNGTQDPGEPGQASVTVNLYGPTGDRLAVTTTSAEGRYAFVGLIPGDYQVEFVAPDGFAFTPPGQGDDRARDSDANPAGGRTAFVSLRSGVTDESVDAGLFNPPTAVTSSPASGEADVALTRETILHFSNPLADPGAVKGDVLFAEFGGQRLAARIHVAADRRSATLFYDLTLPASGRVRVTFVGDALLDVFGNAIDADGDGVPGGVTRIDFDTVTLTTVAGTSVCGRVFASELTPGGEGTSVNVPLEGVIVTVDGAETILRAVTDGQGDFCLDPAPMGRFFVHIDGRAATNAVPVGDYYPVVGKLWESVAGQRTTLSDTYLPRIVAGTLQPVSLTADKTITFPPSVLEGHPELAGVRITVPADSLYADDGSRGGKVGIAPVPPDRLPAPLPPGLDFPIVITVQTDGGTNFDRPVPACFPNLPDRKSGVRLEPGGKSALWSFNHDTGRFEVVGPMTVSEDGMLVCTDPGVGIPAPGWHGARSGTPTAVAPRGLGKPPKDCDEGDLAKKGAELLKKVLKAGADVFNPLRVVNCGYRLLFNSITLGGNLMELLVSLGPGGEELVAPCPGIRTLMTLVDSVGDVLDHCLPPAKRLVDVRDEVNALADSLEILAIEMELGFCGRPMGGLPPAILKSLAAQMKAIAALLAEGDPVKLGVKLAKALLSPLAAHCQFAETVPVPAATRAELEQAAQACNTGEVSKQIQPLLPPLNDTAERLREEVPQKVRESLDPAVRDPRVVEKPADPPIVTVDPEPVFGEPEGDPGAGSQRVVVSGPAQVVLPPNRVVRIRTCEPVSGLYEEVEVWTGPNGRPTYSGEHLLTPEENPVDSDGDALSDRCEAVIGTDPHDADTDGDGLTDGAEVKQGTNPLGGQPVFTGILASVRTPGTAVDVCAANDLAAVAGAGAGVSVLNVFSGQSPTIIAQVDTPGGALAVACAGDLIAVADASRGLAVIDVGDPPAAAIRHQVSLGGSAQAVVTAGRIAYVGLASGSVVAVDMESGAILDQVSLGAAVQDVAVEKDTLFALTVGRLFAIPILESPLHVAGSAASPGGVGAGGRRLRLFVGGGVAYAVHTAGYNTFSLANPAAPVLIAPGTTPQFGWRHLVANGSGLGLAATGLNSTEDGPHDVSLYDLRNPAVTGAFLAEFPTPGSAAAVAIYNGLGYVADGAAGLQVLNYRAYDNLGVAPTISISTNFAAGLAEEARPVRVTAAVADDVQVRNVEFYVDGVRVLTDGSFPFEHRFVAPLIARQPAVTIGACATDTGGNRTCAPDITLLLTEDATPPKVVSVSPAANSKAPEGSVTVVSAAFSEALEAGSVDETTFLLFSAGPDGLAGTADDLAVPGEVLFRDELNAAFLTLPAPLGLDAYRAVLKGSIADSKGNRLGADFAWTFRVAAPNSWINPAGGLWRDGANWSDGLVPGPADSASITLPGSYTVVVDRTTSVGSLTLGGSGAPTLWIRGSNAAGHITFATSNGALTNTATLRLESINSGWESSLAGSVVNEATGVIEVNAGTGGRRTLSGTFTSRGTVKVSSGDGVMTGKFTNLGTLDVAAGGTIVASGSATVFNQDGGQVIGNGTLQVASGASLNYNGGSVVAAPLVRDGKLNFGASADPAIFVMGSAGGVVGGTMAPGQTVWVRGNNAYGHTSVTTSAAGLTSGGVIRLESVNSSWESSLGGNVTSEATGVIEVNAGTGGRRTLSGTFTSRGTMKVSSGDGVITGTFTNLGTLDVAAGGTIVASGGATVFNQDGGQVIGNGALQVASGATLNYNGGSVVTAPVVRDGKLNFGASGDPAIFAMGSAGGVVGGTIAPGQTLWVRGNNAFGHTSVTTSAAGLTSGGVIRLESINSSWESSLGGKVTSEATGVIEVNAGTGGRRTLSGTFTSRGAMKVSSGDGVITGTFTNLGTLDVAAGATIVASGSATVFNQDGGQVTGNASLQVASGATLNYNGGSVVTAPVVRDGKLNFGASGDPAIFAMGSAGGVVGGTIAPGQTLWVRGNNAFGHTSVTTSAAGLTSGGVIRLESINSSWESSLGGKVTSEATGVIEVNAGTGGRRTLSGTFTSRGAMKVSSGDGVITGTFTNLGTLDVAAGATIVASGSATVFNQDGGQVTGNASLQVASGATLNYNGGSVVTAPVVRDGKLNFGASGDPAIFAMGSAGGVVGGTIAPGQTLWVRGNNAFGHTSVTTSAAGLTSGGVIRLESINSGWESSLGGSVTSEATGVIEVNAGTGGSRVLDGTFTSRGTLRVNTTVVLRGAGFHNAEGGRIQGTGTVTLAGAAALTNAGRVLPGNSPGILTVSGGLSQLASGSLDVEIGGRAVGSQHDQLRVSGAAALDGALDITLTGGFDPALGDTFEVLTFGSRSGSFATVNGLSISPAKRFSLSYTASRAVLTVVPE